MNISQFIFTPEGTQCVMSFTHTLITDPKRAELLVNCIATAAAKTEQQISKLSHDEVKSSLAAIHEEQKKEAARSSDGQSGPSEEAEGSVGEAKEDQGGD